jgi:hypothetical protein
MMTLEDLMVEINNQQALLDGLKVELDSVTTDQDLAMAYDLESRMTYESDSSSSID